MDGSEICYNDIILYIGGPARDNGIWYVHKTGDRSTCFVLVRDLITDLDVESISASRLL